MMRQSKGAGEADSSAKRRSILYSAGIAVACTAGYLLLAKAFGAPWQGAIGFSIWLVITLIGVRVFSGRRLETIWPGIAGCVTVVLVGSWKLLS
jgi:hypothetical protein